MGRPVHERRPSAARVYRASRLRSRSRTATNTTAASATSATTGFWGARVGVHVLPVGAQQITGRDEAGVPDQAAEGGQGQEMRHRHAFDGPPAGRPGCGTGAPSDREDAVHGSTGSTTPAPAPAAAPDWASPSPPRSWRATAAASNSERPRARAHASPCCSRHAEAARRMRPRLSRRGRRSGRSRRDPPEGMDHPAIRPVTGLSGARVRNGTTTFRWAGYARSDDDRPPKGLSPPRPRSRPSPRPE